MTNEEVETTLKKLSYQVSILGQTVDYERHPVEALILEKDWGSEELDKAHDIFENWEKRLESGENMDSAMFEQDFRRELGVTYQGVKPIILAFYKNGQWTNVCEAFVDSFGPSPALEYHSIMRRER